MPQRTLSIFYRKFYGKTDFVLRDFLVASPANHLDLSGVSVDVVLRHSRNSLMNRLFHLWGEFCRHVIVASALGGYTTVGGSFLMGAPNIQNISDILSTMRVSSITGPNIRWGDPQWTLAKLNVIRPANLQQIMLGVGSAPYDEFRRVRNFVIHSNPHTRSNFDSVAVSYSLVGVDADDLLLHRLAGGGTIMENWVRDFQAAALDAVR